MVSKSSERSGGSTESKFNEEPVSRVVPKLKGRERKEVQMLLERGRVQGHLTYDELNDALPPDMVTSDQIDDLMVWLRSEDAGGTEPHERGAGRRHANVRAAPIDDPATWRRRLLAEEQ
jgi:hypothetical protein